MLNKRNIYLLMAVMALTLVYCNRYTEGEEAVILAHSGYYLNLHDTVRYLGMETCQSCHADVHDTYIHTGMGRSFANATQARSDAHINDHSLVYDHHSNLYYRRRTFYSGFNY